MQVEIKGEVAPGYEPVKQAFADLWKDIEVGASLCIYREGRPVVDLWGGYRDREMTDPWQADTLVNIYSTTKGLASLAFAQLVDHGLLGYQDKVSRYWPEFAQAGKGEITIAELLSHKGGLAGVSETLTVPDLYDWDKMTDLLAKQAPLWEPGTKAGYHAVTWGYLPGELVRRVSGQTLGEWFRDQVAEPLGADAFIGLPDQLHERCAVLVGPNRARKLPAPAPTSSPVQEPPFYRVALQNPAISPFRDACSAPWRRAELAASNGHASARGVARIYAAMAEGGSLDGVKIISESALAEARVVEVDASLGPDLVTGTPMHRSRGFILAQDGNYGPSAKAFGHAGAGGSMGFADPETRIGFAYLMNQMQADSASIPRSKRLIDALKKCS